MGDVVVANPGSLDWMNEAATAVAETGRLRRYVTPIAVGSRRASAVASWRVPMADRVATELRRRPIPAGVDPAAVQRSAAVAELLTVGVGRVPPIDRLDTRVTWWRDRVFDRALRRSLQAGDRGVVVSHGSALRTLEAARTRGITSFLVTGIAHHELSARTLAEEAVRQPEFAPTLQFHDLPAPQADRLDAEVALADHVIVLSEFQRRSFVEAGVPERKLLQIPLGVDLDLFQPGQRPDDGTFRVLFVGQLTQRKGLSYVLDAFRLAEIPNSELLLVGRPIGTATPWQGRPGVRHSPAVPRWELPSIYASADVFVFPSLIEGFGLTLVEAMACGLPVIVTDGVFGGLAPHGEVGYAVPPHDAASIAERLGFLHDNPEIRAKLGVAATAHARSFSWERYRTTIAQTVNEHAPPR